MSQTTRYQEYSSRCEYVYNDGRRCRMPRVHEQCSLCYFHWDREMNQQEAARIATGIVAATDNLATARGVNRVLTRLFREVAAGRIHPRTARTLAYLSNLIISTLPHVARERREEPEEPAPLVDPPQPVAEPVPAPPPPGAIHAGSELPALTPEDTRRREAAVRGEAVPPEPLPAPEPPLPPEYAAAFAGVRLPRIPGPFRGWTKPSHYERSQVHSSWAPSDNFAPERDGL